MKMNDEDRRLWVMNDEILYNLWQSADKGLYSWVQENRKLIDNRIDRVLDREPAS